MNIKDQEGEKMTSALYQAMRKVSTGKVYYNWIDGKYRWVDNTGEPLGTRSFDKLRMRGWITFERVPGTDKEHRVRMSFQGRDAWDGAPAEPSQR